MSINRSRGAEETPNRRFRNVIWLVLASSLAAFQPADTAVSNEPGGQERNEDPFDGLKIVPDDTPKKQPVKKIDPPTRREKPIDMDSIETPFCTPITCKRA